MCDRTPTRRSTPTARPHARDYEPQPSRPRRRLSTVVDSHTRPYSIKPQLFSGCGSKRVAARQVLSQELLVICTRNRVLS